MGKLHFYNTSLRWTGNTGSGTSSYRNYERSYVVSVENKPLIEGSSDPAFRGDPARYNPEELLLASLSSCHMLWYLHLCAEAGVIVVGYSDEATGKMTENPDGGGRFSEVILRPVVTVSEPGMVERALLLHAQANERCFIANSVNFPVQHQPKIMSNLSQIFPQT